MKIISNMITIFHSFILTINFESNDLLIWVVYNVSLGTEICKWPVWSIFGPKFNDLHVWNKGLTAKQPKISDLHVKNEIHIFKTPSWNKSCDSFLLFHSIKKIKLVFKIIFIFYFLKKRFLWNYFNISSTRFKFQFLCFKKIQWH